MNQRTALCVFFLLSAAACSDDPKSSGTGAGGAGGVGSGGSGGMAGMGGMASSSSGGPACVEGMTQSCYDGPPGTKDVGLCVGGTATCLPGGAGFGPCEGQVLPAADDCKTPADENCDGANALCAGATYWSKRFGGSLMAATEEKLGGLAADASGNVIIAGHYHSTMDFGGGLELGGGPSAYDGFVAKLDGTGKPIWARKVTATNIFYMRGACVDPQGNVAVVGETDGGIDAGGGIQTGSGTLRAFVVGYDPDGNHRFTVVSQGSSMAFAEAVACGADGTIGLVGYFGGNLTFGGNQITDVGGWDAYVVTFDAAGQVSYTKRYGDASFQAATGVDFDSQGRLVFSGYNAGTINFGNGIVLASGLYVARLGPTGEHQSDRAFPGGGQGNMPVRVAAGPNDAAIVTTASEDQPTTVNLGLSGPQSGTFFMVKVDASTSPVWGRAFSGAGGLQGAVFAKNGDVVVTGALRGSVDFGSGTAQVTAGKSDIVVASYGGGDGAWHWSRVVGDSDGQSLPQWGEAVDVDPNGDLLVGGSFEGAIHWGDQEHIASFGFGWSDVFVAKIAP